MQGSPHFGQDNCDPPSFPFPEEPAEVLGGFLPPLPAFPVGVLLPPLSGPEGAADPFTTFKEADVNLRVGYTAGIWLLYCS